ncbi:UNVERIFIED_CONTAM: Basic leucine zipper 61 [Sesamum angustifolium]|uniref:Basic leucine zipper 61 n=1 Tax=Sesamum angustifolium TaxID=2727405 RepID=A0AAW2PC72_9LAMI
MPTPSTAAPPGSWMDDFLDFSASRRSAHRRTVSDPIAFVEAPTSFMEEPHDNNNNNGFERLDDEQLRNMFSDDVPATRSSSNPPRPRIRTVLKFMRRNPHPSTTACSPRLSLERILANRQSAQRSRVRKLQYISELERSVTTLQTEVSALSPRVAFLDHQRLLLNVDNSALKQRIAALAQDKIFKDAHQEALKKEIERLRKIYHEQNMKKLDNKTTGEAPAPPQPPPAAAFSKRGCTEEEQ